MRGRAVTLHAAPSSASPPEDGIERIEGRAPRRPGPAPRRRAHACSSSATARADTRRTVTGAGAAAEPVDPAARSALSKRAALLGVESSRERRRPPLSAPERRPRSPGLRERGPGLDRDDRRLGDRPAASPWPWRRVASPRPDRLATKSVNTEMPSWALTSVSGPRRYAADRGGVAVSVHCPPCALDHSRRRPRLRSPAARLPPPRAVAGVERQQVNLVPRNRHAAWPRAAASIRAPLGDDLYPAAGSRTSWQPGTRVDEDVGGGRLAPQGDRLHPRRLLRRLHRLAGAAAAHRLDLGENGQRDLRCALAPRSRTDRTRTRPRLASSTPSSRSSFRMAAPRLREPSS